MSLKLLIDAAKRNTPEKRTDANPDNMKGFIDATKPVSKEDVQKAMGEILDGEGMNIFKKDGAEATVELGPKKAWTDCLYLKMVGEVHSCKHFMAKCRKESCPSKFHKYSE